jgi:predicted PurR-regulated permease PerM
MWAILLAILVGERLMGVSGMILGPAFLYFLCVQLRKIPSQA